jgi:hypothetical protein
MTGCLAVWASPLLAADLAKVPRTISREPAYRSGARYMLLAFGAEVKFRVWLVFDGDVVYVDRNGNGDLAEPGERVEPSEKPTEEAFLRISVYDLGPIKDPFTGKTYEQVNVQRTTLKPEVAPTTPAEKERKEFLQKNGTPAWVYILDDGKIKQAGFLSCAEKPAKAHILHFDGPLTFQFVDGQLRRGDEPAELSVELTTPGLGKSVYHYMSFAVAPAEVHPLALIEFPVKAPGGPPVRREYRLEKRC